MTIGECLDRYNPLLVEACRAVYERHHNSLDFSPCDIEDLVQCARIRVVRKWHILTYRTSPAPYLRRIATTAAIDELRRLQRVALPIDLSSTEAA